MTELNFCPFCDASQHKLMACKNDIFFCKECNRFFRFSELEIKCPRCKGSMRNSDFPMPSGEVLFQCVKCKKTYPAGEVLEDIE